MVFDGQGVAHGASGNRAGIAHPYFAQRPYPREQLYALGMEQVRYWLTRAGDRVEHGWTAAHETPDDAAAAQRLQSISSKLVGASWQHQRLVYDACCWLSPPQLCHYLLDHPRIHLRRCDVSRIESSAPHHASRATSMGRGDSPSAMAMWPRLMSW